MTANDIMLLMVPVSGLALGLLMFFLTKHADNK